MTIPFINSFISEWLKTKRSLALWIVIIGGFFTPAIVTVARIIQYKTLPTVYSSGDFWKSLWQFFAQLLHVVRGRMMVLLEVDQDFSVGG